MNPHPHRFPLGPGNFRHGQNSAGEAQTGQPAFFVLGFPRGRQHRPGVHPAGDRLKIEMGRHFLHRPHRPGASVRQKHQRVRQIQNFVHGMADVENGNVQLPGQPGDEGHNLRLAGGVQGGQRLVHEQQVRAGQQGAADGDPLLFPAGKAGRMTFQQMADAQQIHHPVEADPPLPTPHPLPAVLQIGPNGEVGKQPPVLENVAEPALLRRQVHARRSVENHPVADHDPPGVRRHQPRHHGDDRGFPRAGMAEQRRHAGFPCRERRVHPEISLHPSNIHVQHVSPPRSIASPCAGPALPRRSAPPAPQPRR